MTTTEQHTVCEHHPDEPAFAHITAQHFDPDADDTGRAIGWSEPLTSTLCEECVEEWENDSLVDICETVYV